VIGAVPYLNAFKSYIFPTDFMRTEYLLMLERWRLQKSHLANQAGLPTARVSDYIHGRALPDDKERAIEQAIVQSSKIQAAFFPIRLALDEPDNVKMALSFVTATYGHASPEQIMQLKTAAEISAALHATPENSQQATQ
jgi:hypothetical protein